MLEVLKQRFFFGSNGDQISGEGVGHNTSNEHMAQFLNQRGLRCEFDYYSGDHCFAEWQERLIIGLIKTQKMQDQIKKDQLDTARVYMSHYKGGMVNKRSNKSRFSANPR